LKRPATIWEDRGRCSDAFVFVALTGAISLSLISIAASQILLFAAIMGAVSLQRKDLTQFLRTRPPFVWPLLSFAAWTVLTCLASRNILLSLSETRKFFLYLILILVPFALRNSDRRIHRVYESIFAASLISASAGIGQFAADPTLDLLNRISGLLSHWMTYSGLLMLALIGLAAYSVCRRGRIAWWVFPLGAFLIAGMYFSQTRNSWLGSITGIIAVFLLRRPRAILPMAILLGVLYFASPESMQVRLRSSWDRNDPENRSRIELFHTSLRLIGEHPWLGVGPKNVNKEALHYRGSHEFGDWLYQHMHNNILQIAAERGIPGLLLWLWLMIRLGWDAIRVFRSANASAKESGNSEAALMASTAAIGAWIALFVAGMFEFNFGDSEVLTLYLFMAAAPYAFYRPVPAENQRQPLR
jgi:O-antigen ligase